MITWDPNIYDLIFSQAKTTASITFYVVEQLSCALLKVLLAGYMALNVLLVLCPNTAPIA